MKNYEIQEVPADQKYWFFRTEAGSYYPDFYLNDFIAYGWDELTDLAYIKNSDHDTLKEKFHQLYPDEKRPGLAINQMNVFIDTMAIGDIVIIPAASSEHIGIGLITSEVYIAPPPDPFEDAPEDIGYAKCPYKKRRKVHWLKSVPRNKIDPYLFKLMCAINTISDASNYDSFIDRMIYPLYIKNDQVHLTVRVDKKDKISAIDMAKLISGIVGMFDVPSTDTFYSDLNDLEIRVNVQSPGVIEFIGGGLALCTICGALALLLSGAKINFSAFGTKFSVESEGLIEKYLKYKHEENEHVLELKQVMSRMQISVPEPIVTKKLPDNDD